MYKGTKVLFKSGSSVYPAEIIKKQAKGYMIFCYRVSVDHGTPFNPKTEYYVKKEKRYAKKEEIELIGVAVFRDLLKKLEIEVLREES